MMGLPGMRSTQLPVLARVDAARVRFLLRCATLPGFERPCVVFGAADATLKRVRPGSVGKRNG